MAPRRSAFDHVRRARTNGVVGALVAAILVIVGGTAFLLTSTSQPTPTGPKAPATMQPTDTGAPPTTGKPAPTDTKPTPTDKSEKPTKPKPPPPDPG
jgi:hypothetical protein